MPSVLNTHGFLQQATQNRSANYIHNTSHVYTSAMSRFLLLATVLCLLTLPSFGQEKRPLDHDDVNAWRHLGAAQLSDSGQWVVWEDAPAEGDSRLYIRSVDGTKELDVDRGSDARILAGESWLAFRLKAPFDSTRQAKLAEKKKDELPADSMGIVDLRTLQVRMLGTLGSEFRTPDEAGAWLAWTTGAMETVEDTTKADSTLSDRIPKKGEGQSMVVFDPATESRAQFDHVTHYTFSENGGRLVFTRQSRDGAHDGVYELRPGMEAPDVIAQAPGRYTRPVFDTSGSRLAFMTDAADWPAEQPRMQLMTKSGSDALQAVSEAFLPADWWISEHGSVRFSESGARLFFGTAPVPEPEPEKGLLLDNESIEVDVWSWTDPLLQPMQLVQRKSELERTYDAMIHLASGRTMQLETVAVPELTVSEKGDGRWALAESNMPYRQEISWESPGFRDAYLIDLESDTRTVIFEGLQANASLSPGGSWTTWWDGHTESWMGHQSSTGRTISLSAGIPTSLADPLHDWPMLIGSEGAAGWLEDDAGLLLYDAHDIWLVDPNQPAAPRNVTEGTGRQQDMRFRVVDLDRDNPYVEPDLVLSAFSYVSKENGFYTDRVRGDRAPRMQVFEPASFGRLSRADDNPDVFMYTKGSFREYPDLRVATGRLDDARQVSNTNPQQDTFSWGQEQLVHWTSTDGQLLDGILYTPDGFDPSEQYPMMVYFYEKSSEGLFNHFAPRASRASIDRSFYVSRGYVLFVPDIPYKVGYPGESAMNAVMPGITSLIEQGFVDRARIGVQGHSWGGYQIAYMVTKTNLFAAAEAGAPVSNMTSAYGGIRWASGMSRMFQYERTQSRIGGTLWNAQHRYISNSPLFEADKVETPLLMMHNDEDGAVPWYQGIEYFVALRRLGKPVWMLNYNGEAHGLTNLHNQRDWAIRMQQFFDHYLMDAPAPVWLREGVPAVKKGYTLGLEE